MDWDVFQKSSGVVIEKNGSREGRIRGGDRARKEARRQKKSC